MNKTPNYSLNQWEAEDRVLRTDFNADNAKIDAALAGKTEIVLGTYTGDGAESRVIDLGFTPKAVYLCSRRGRTCDYNTVGTFEGGLFLRDCPLAMGDAIPPAAESIIAEIVENGFRVRHVENTNQRYFILTNNGNMVYHYVAFR